MVRYYVDTCIWIDYWENRTDGLRPLGEFAFQFFQRCIENEDVILYSDLTVHELSKKYPIDIIEKIFEMVSEANILMKVNTPANARMYTKNIPIHSSDALHVFLATIHHSTLVTRDEEMRSLGGKKPEEL